VREDDGAAKLSRYRLNLRRVLVADVDGASGHDTVRRGSPRLAVRDERKVAWLGHLDRDVFELPAAPELVRLEMRVRQSPFHEAVACPVRRTDVCWRSGEPRADFVGERSIQRDRPGALQSLGLDAPEHIAAVALLCRN